MSRNRESTTTAELSGTELDRIPNDADAGLFTEWHLHEIPRIKGKSGGTR